jgi:uncharacterized membrane protein YhaH (DUF805 family)
MGAYTNAMRRYFDFSGRTSRSQFWLYILFYVIIVIIAMLIDVYAFGAMERGTPVGILTGIVLLVHIIPSLSAQIRRLHDSDRSGWWWFISFVPAIGGIWLLVLFCFAGTPGSNRFGPPDV